MTFPLKRKDHTCVVSSCIVPTCSRAPRATTPAPHDHINAFTLIEIIIALVIFAILGILMAIMMHNTIDANQKANEANENMQQIEIAQTLLRRDFSQVVDRSVTDVDGGTLNALTLNENSISFTRGGFLNPFNLSNRSDLQRVEYSYKNHHLYRYAWPVLDRVLDTTKPIKIDLLKNVKNFKMQVYDESNQLQKDWPVTVNTTLHSTNQPTSDLPRAIKITITLDKQGTFDDIITLPSRGVLGNNGY